tara:strand:- start:349 stop:765 length:417 start_codon:yes stop_codon:yes gene_type:complete
MKNLISKITKMIKDFVRVDNHVVIRKEEFNNFIDDIQNQLDDIKHRANDHDYMIDCDSGRIEEYIKDAVWDAVSNLDLYDIDQYIDLDSRVSDECKDVRKQILEFKEKHCPTPPADEVVDKVVNKVMEDNIDSTQSNS